MLIPTFCAIVASPVAPSFACDFIDVDADHHACDYAVADLQAGMGHRFDSMERRFENVETRLANVEREQTHLAGSCSWEGMKTALAIKD